MDQGTSFPGMGNEIGRSYVARKITLWGIVQGVGFRPFVAKLADRMGVLGEVRNTGGLVEIWVTDTPARIEAFLSALLEKKPAPAEIVHIKQEDAPFRLFDSFAILDSGEGDDEAAIIPADLSICPDCLSEFADPANPRYHHPFISCMICGPRYSIIDRIPYDRQNTSMDSFPMCDFCKGEYENRSDRRYHAQTISCHHCGPMLKVHWNGTEPASLKSEDPISLAASLILNGKIIAVKGVGGYNYICSPFQEQTVKDLRRLKGREEKPFAVMFRDRDQIRQRCMISPEEERLLLSNAKPIVLLEKRGEEQNQAGLQDFCEDTCRTSRFIGAFLPSMALHHRLLDLCGPLIVTSANRADVPIIKDEEEIFAVTDPLLSAVFYHDREIRIRLDDSVVRVIDGQPQMIRRSKGYAPMPLFLNRKAEAGQLPKEAMVLAVGGQLKSAFCLSKGPFAYVSQYFGDLDTEEAFAHYKENVERLEDLLRIRPNLVACDLHPHYRTTMFAESQGIPLLRVQHHHAHVASVMAEHDLTGPVLGVSMDGTGYGPDGTIWGGEFLLCEGETYERVGHLATIPMLGGDSSMKEGWKSAMCYLHHILSRPEESSPEQKSTLFEHLFNHPLTKDSRYELVKAGLTHRINAIESSSMGRLFDAVAAFLEIHDINRYEGECAIRLENAATAAYEAGLDPYPLAWNVTQDRQVDAGNLFLGLAQGRNLGVDTGSLALGFHVAVAQMIHTICEEVREERNVRKVALTGGVFQNKLVMDLTLARLREAGFMVYYNVSVGPNDGGICLGQVYLGMKHLEKEESYVHCNTRTGSRV